MNITNKQELASGQNLEMTSITLSGYGWRLLSNYDYVLNLLNKSIICFSYDGVSIASFGFFYGGTVFVGVYFDVPEITPDAVGIFRFNAQDDMVFECCFREI